MVNLPENLFDINGAEMNAVPWKVKRNSWEKEGRNREAPQFGGGTGVVGDGQDGGKALRK